jgi:hypothetical protein
MKYVEGDFIKSQEAEYKLFGKIGNTLDDEESQKVACYAKILKNERGTVHYICTYQGVPLDPMGPFGRRERSLDSKMQRVSKNTFDLYLTYLKTNNSIYLTKAQRGLHND